MSAQAEQLLQGTGDAGELGGVGAGGDAKKVDDQRPDDLGRQGAAALEIALGQPAVAQHADMKVDHGQRAVSVDLARQRLDRELKVKEGKLEGELGPRVGKLGKLREPP